MSFGTRAGDGVEATVVVFEVVDFGNVCPEPRLGVPGVVCSVSFAGWWCDRCWVVDGNQGDVVAVFMAGKGR